MTTTDKLGFNGQWVDGTPVGRHVDSDGDTVDLDLAFLEAVVANYDPQLHAAPATIGHPKTDAPAYGWVATLRVKDGRLERQFSEVDPQFEDIVRHGYFKKRSDAFYLDPKDAPGGRAPYLRHVGFLGAQPPAIKGIRDIHFEEGKTVFVEVDSSQTEFSEGDAMTDAEKRAAQEETKKTTREAVTEFFREMFGGGKEKSAASFSEADAQAIVDKAVGAVELKFSETLKERDDKIKELTERLDSQAGSSQRSEIVAFCESIGAQRILPAFRNMGLVAFMEELAAVPAKKVTVITFTEDAGKQVEKKAEMPLLDWFKAFLKAMPEYVQFGEQFGSLRVSAGEAPVDEDRIASMRQAAGMTPKPVTETK